MTPVTILCEGPRCNAGRSARDREAAHIRSLTPTTEEMRALADREARGRVSRDLRYTPHARAGVGRGGAILFACEVCGHELVYGTHSWGPSPYVGAINQM